MSGSRCWRLSTVRTRNARSSCSGGARSDRRRITGHRLVADPGPQGVAARAALAALPAAELLAPGHFAVEVMSALGAAAGRPAHPLRPEELLPALQDAAVLEITIEATPWSDVHRAWTLAQGSLRYANAIYIAAAERHGAALLTADSRIQRCGALIRCEVITVEEVKVEPMAHGYTNATVTDHQVVVKTYPGPDSQQRQVREELALRKLAGRLPVPTLLDSTTGTLTTRFLSGVPGTTQSRQAMQPKCCVLAADFWHSFNRLTRETSSRSAPAPRWFTMTSFPTTCSWIATSGQRTCCATGSGSPLATG